MKDKLLLFQFPNGFSPAIRVEGYVFINRFFQFPNGFSLTDYSSFTNPNADSFQFPNGFSLQYIPVI